MSSRPKQRQPAIIFMVWTLVAGLSDNILKPLLLGRGLEVPMPVILIGVIGGMLADGLLGLFVGPVLLAVGYVLLIEWLRQHPVEGEPQIDGSGAVIAILALGLLAMSDLIAQHGFSFPKGSGTLCSRLRIGANGVEGRHSADGQGRGR